ncbi:hypothetical protein NPIL_452701 [Nephila pilipes]|uniref:Uncharacterized protein n=1 Tax=Nephila pilipes TaxID=299642 RepID=A0A8X6TBE1_NEPPI|nr:hypothetical protein NPIL_452701 [Nephila pilipes]
MRKREIKKRSSTKQCRSFILGLFASMTSESVDVDEFDMLDQDAVLISRIWVQPPTSEDHDEDPRVVFSENHLDESAISVVSGRKRNLV